MNILLWGVFYLVATLFLLYFFVKEKQVIHWIRVKEDEILKKVLLEKNQKKCYDWKYIYGCSIDCIGSIFCNCR